ncbi:MAG: glutamate--tRNA ligase, partial [Coxiellaceae bacterium]|nr:glutamate--tRNA ligase [Coxiellaceae bacterium]
VAKPLEDQFHKLGIDYEKGPNLDALIELQAERTKTLEEMVERSRYFFEDDVQYDEKAASKHLKPEILLGLETVREKIAALADWDKEALHQIIIDVAESLELKLGKLAQPIRVAMTGVTMSPPMDVTLFYIGRERVLARLDKAIQYIKERG